MKKLMYLAIAVLSLSVAAIGQTNESKTFPNVPSAAEVPDGKAFGGYELTLGGGGTHIKGQNTVGVDVSLSTNPLEFAPNLWFGAVQGAYWEPSFSGSTDFNVNWNWHLWQDLYLNTGWSAGGVYDTSSLSWRTGPEATFQYYMSNDVFVYSGVNYDIPLCGDGVERGFRYSFGIGFAF